MQRVAELVQDPRPVEEKQQLVLQVGDTLLSFVCRRQQAHSSPCPCRPVLPFSGGRGHLDQLPGAWCDS